MNAGIIGDGLYLEVVVNGEKILLERIQSQDIFSVLDNEQLNNHNTKNEINCNSNYSNNNNNSDNGCNNNCDNDSSNNFNCNDNCNNCNINNNNCSVCNCNTEDKYDDKIDILNHQINKMTLMGSEVKFFDIEECSNKKMLNISVHGDLSDFNKEIIGSIMTDNTRDKIKAGLIITTFMAGGLLIGGPIGAMIAAKVAMGGTVLMAAGAAVGAGAGYGIGDKVTKDTIKKSNEGSDIWYYKLYQPIEDSIISFKEKL